MCFNLALKLVVSCACTQVKAMECRAEDTGTHHCSDIATAQQQQQQLQLLQMYGYVPQALGCMGMAVSYSGMPSATFLQPAPCAGPAGLSLVKPLSTVELNPLQVAATHSAAGLPVSYVPLAAATIHPAAAAAAMDVHSSLVQTPNGSWLAPVPLVGSCVINPLQPGLWVK